MYVRKSEVTNTTSLTSTNYQTVVSDILDSRKTDRKLHGNYKFLTGVKEVSEAGRFQRCP